MTVLSGNSCRLLLRRMFSPRHFAMRYTPGASRSGTETIPNLGSRAHAEAPCGGKHTIQRVRAGNSGENIQSRRGRSGRARKSGKKCTIQLVLLAGCCCWRCRQAMQRPPAGAKNLQFNRLCLLTKKVFYFHLRYSTFFALHCTALHC